MENIINNRTLTANKLLELPSPVLLCSKRDDFIQAIADADIQTVSLNLPLARELMGKTENEIATSVTATALRLMPDGLPVFLSDYEMLFDPRYKLDVIKVFCEISRYNTLIVKWCGSFDGDALIYAEPGYDDYSRYRVSDYEIACVI